MKFESWSAIRTAPFLFVTLVLLALALAIGPSHATTAFETATVTATCEQYTVAVSGRADPNAGPHSVTYQVTLTSATGPALTFTGSFQVVPDPQSYNYSQTITQSIGPLTGAYTVSGQAQLIENGHPYLDLPPSDLDPTNGTVECEPCMTSIGDRVWVDTNGNGIQDRGEPGVSGVIVNLWDAAHTGIVATTQTNSNGNYLFSVPCGSYTVEIVPPAGSTLTTPNAPNSTPSDDSNPNPSSVTPPNDGSDLTIDFGLVRVIQPCSTMIGDRVWYDQNLNGIQDAGEPGMPGVEVHLRQAGQTTPVATTFTDGNGDYLFTADCGSYEVDIVPPAGYAMTVTNAGTPSTDSNPNPSSVEPPNNGQDLTVDFGLVRVQELCPPAGTTGLPNPVGTLFWGVDASGDVTVRYEQARGLNDNSYGTNIVQWPRDHKFNDLVGSDKAEFVFTNGAGAPVLDFFLDYISSASGTPSGYRSLGPLGGDGKMVAGSSAHVLSWDSSLARNLNNTGLCVGGNCSGGGTDLKVSSPPTVSASDYTLPAGSPYGAWDFTNAYYMRISAAAFGSSGFGGVMVGEQHNSPPKVGSNGLVPVVCEPDGGGSCDLSSGSVTFKDKQVKWSLTNNGSTAAVLSQLAIVWPSVNGKLSKVKFDGDVVWDDSIAWTATGTTLTSAQLTADAKKKRIDPGKTRIVTFEFEKRASTDLSQYSVTLSFGTGCEVTMPNTPPPLSGNFCATAPGSGRAKTLTMVYLDANEAAAGSNCTTNCNQQDASKVIVTGDPNNASPVYIIATPTGKTGQFFAGPVSLDGQFTMSAANAGLTTFDTNTTVNLYSGLGGTLLSSVQYHTSCSQPLNDGDYFGSLELVGFTR